jgi:D-alanyl-D-alanine carboxypeptidase
VIVLGLTVLWLAAASGQAGPSLVFDAKTGEVLHASEPGKHWYPASLTKLLTAYIVFQDVAAGKLEMSTKITVSALARAQPPSKIGLPVGTKITVERALEALLVRSANDIAVVLAEGAGGTLENFVRRMNETASKLGMTGSYFANPHGLPDIRQRVTARDMGLLARALIKEFPQHDRFYRKPYFRIGKRRFRNRNGLLRRMKDADGMKTGFICASGYNLVASATRRGRKLVAVVLGAKSGGQRTVRANALLDNGFNGAKGANGGDVKISAAAVTGGLSLVSNEKSVSPTSSMHKVVCRRASPLRLSRPSRIKGWGVVFGEYDRASAANTALNEHLMKLRHVVYAGYGAIVKDYKTGKIAALIGDLDTDQVEKVCNVLKAGNARCRKIEPGTLKDPPRVKRKRGKRRVKSTRKRRIKTVRRAKRRNFARGSGRSRRRRR